MARKRSTYPYRLLKNGKTVRIGITKNPSRRRREHKNSGIRFTTMKVYPARTKSSALKYEKKMIKTYKKKTGRKPRHNN